MKEPNRHLKPTYENQLWQARRLLNERGIDALNNPHAMTGRICGCGSCFCCAALQVYDEAKQQIASRVNVAVGGAA